MYSFSYYFYQNLDVIFFKMKTRKSEIIAASASLENISHYLSFSRFFHLLLCHPYRCYYAESERYISHREHTRSNKQRYNSRGWRNAFATFNAQYLIAGIVKECIMRSVCARNNDKRGLEVRRDSAFPIKAGETLIKTCYV